MDRYIDIQRLQESIILSWNTCILEDADTDRRRESLLNLDRADTKYLADIAVSATVYYMYTVLKEILTADEK